MSLPLESRLARLLSPLLEFSAELEPPLEFRESKAKSIRPEDGLMITSWIVPTRCPEESVTCAPDNLLARTRCSLFRPVALSRFVLELRFADESFDC